MERQISKAANRSSESHDAVYSYSCVVALISEFLSLTGPTKPKYSVTCLVCETSAEYYNEIGEELYATIDEIRNDDRIKTIWSTK
jgi:hypothetical protein